MKSSSSLILIAFLLFASVGCKSKSEREQVVTVEVADTVAPLDCERTVRIMMMGDIMMGSQCPWDGRFMTSDDGKSLFDSVKPLLAQGDFVVGNLEGVLLDRTPQAEAMLNTFSAVNFMMPQRYVNHLIEAGFTAMAVTNNHANDFHGMGVDSTRATLKRANMPYSGVKKDGSYTIIESDGVRYALCAFSPSPGGSHIDDIEGAAKVVHEADSLADIVVVSFHGGCEGTAACHVPREREVFNNGLSRGDVFKFARACVDAGGDVIFGHGPHVVRGIEIYKDRIIAYSLGNFCTPLGMSIVSTLGYAPLLDVEVDDHGVFKSGKIHSFMQRRGKGPVLDTDHRAAREIDRLSQSDFPDTRPNISPIGEISKR